MAGERRLIFNGIRLKDGRTLSDYNIQNNAVIYVRGQTGAAFPIYIRFPTGEKIRTTIAGVKTIWDLKSRLQIWVPPQLPHGKELETKEQW